MFTRTLRIAMHRKEGQALVLAALMVLILSIAVLATINLGHNITERVRLQNTADAAAYSMAAMEARAFNFYAFSNRTHVSHYVAAMVWQSMLSFLYFLEAFFTDVFGVLLTSMKCGDPQGTWVAVCNAITLIPIVGPILKGVFSAFKALLTIVEALVRSVQGTLKLVNPDKYIGRYVIPGHRVLNMALSGLAQATLYGTMTHLASTSNEVIVDNDPNVDSAATRLLSGLLSACILQRAHMKEAGVHGTANLLTINDPLNVQSVGEDDKVARAKRSMGKISNATRFACDNEGGGSLCGPGWVTDRRAGQLIPLPGNFGIVRDLISAIDWKWGQTKMLSHSFGLGKDDKGNDRNYIRDWKNDLPNHPIADLTQGDSIGSDDIYRIKVGPTSVGIPGFSVINPFACKDTDDPLRCWGDNRQGKDDTHPFKNTTKTSIWAQSPDEDPDGDGGIHWRLVTSSGINPGSKFSDLPVSEGSTPNPYKDLGINLFRKTIINVLALELKLDVYVANVRPIRDENHPWDGIVKFPHFEPGQYDGECTGGDPDPTKAATRAHEFNQPSTWVVLNKTAEQTLNPKQDSTGAGNNKPALLNDTGAITFAFNQPKKLVLDNTTRTFLTFKGLNVISRGQTYYHRPGNWAEQPNFFNPYWKPRLASVYQGRYSFPLVERIESVLPGPFKSLPQKIITH